MTRGMHPFVRLRGDEASLDAICPEVGLPTPEEVAAQAARDKPKA